MKFGDFSSVVQLGVGLHVGTALLEIMTELTAAPLSIRLARLRDLARKRAARDKKFSEYADDAIDLLGDLDIKRIQFFNEYKQIVMANGGFAIGLCVLLAMIAFLATWEIPVFVGFLVVVFSFGPAGISLCLLWSRWRRNTSGLRTRVSELEEKITAP